MKMPCAPVMKPNKSTLGNTLGSSIELEGRAMNGKPDRDPEPLGAPGLIALAIICGTILGVVWIVWG